MYGKTTRWDVVCCILYTVYCMLCILHCTLYVVQCKFYSERCMLYTVCCTLYTVQCVLYSILCILYEFTAKYESVSCYHVINNEISGFPKNGEFPEQLSYYWILCFMVLGLDRSGLEQGQVAGICECGNEPSGSIKCGEFFDQLRTGQLLKKATTTTITTTTITTAAAATTVAVTTTTTTTNDNDSVKFCTLNVVVQQP